MSVLVLAIFVFCIFGTVILAVMGALSDYRGLKIPNIYSVLVLALFFVAYGVLYVSGAHHVFGSILAHVLSSIVMFVLTLVLYLARMIGAGDSKFAASLSIWAGLSGISFFLFFMAVTGGLLGAVTLYLQNKKPVASPAADGWIDQVQKGANKVPYGIAIAAGAVVSMLHNDFFSYRLWLSILEM